MTKSTEVIYGLHAVRHLLQHNPHRVLNLWIQDRKQSAGEVSEICRLGKEKEINIQRVSKSALDKHAENGVHQGVLAYVKPGVDWGEKDLPQIIQSCQEFSPLLLVLDGVQDPHNLGACIRSANAAGVNAVIIPRDKSVSITSVVRKAASGAVETTPVISVANLARTLRTLKEMGIWLVGTDSKADQVIFDIDLKVPVAIVTGSEGTGLRKNTRDHCDFLVSLPIHGIVESLNLSVATGVFLYEVLRQRTQNK